MANNKKGSLTPIQTGGLTVDPENSSVSFSPSQMEAGDNFFWADHFKVQKAGSVLKILFGQIGYHTEKKELNLAVEVIFPINYAMLSLYKSVCIEPSLTGVGAFLDTLNNNVIGLEKKYGELSDGTEFQDFSVPENIMNFRRFPVNFSSSSIANGEAMIDFFEASPHMISNALNGGHVRPNERVKSVVSIICGPKLLQAFLLECQKMLKPFYNGDT